MLCFNGVWAYLPPIDLAYLIMKIYAPTVNIIGKQLCKKHGYLPLESKQHGNKEEKSQNLLLT